MGLGCSDESRQKYGKWCALLDGIIGATWAAVPDRAGVLAVGTGVLDPNVPKAVVLIEINKYNLEMAEQGKDGIDRVWAGEHPMEAYRELKRRRGY